MSRDPRAVAASVAPVPALRRLALGLAGLAWAASLGLASPASAATATVTITIHDGGHAAVSSVVIGTTVHAFVRVTGGSGTPTGTVVVARYANGTCSGAPAATSSAVGLAAGTVDLTGFAFQTSAVGTFSFGAGYQPAAGSPYVASAACRSFTVAKANPSIALILRRLNGETVTSVPVGEAVQALLLVGNVPGVPTPTGTARIQIFGGGSCTGAALGAHEGLLDAGLLSFSGSYEAAGQFSYRGSYDGDTRYRSASSECMPLTVTKIAATLKVLIHNASHRIVETVPVGTTVHARVSISGTEGPGQGTVTVLFFESRTCSGNDVATESALVSGTVDGANPQLLAAAGSFGYRVAWDGDARYLPATSNCLPISAEAAAPSATPGPTPPNPTPSIPPTASPGPTPSASAPAPTAQPTDLTPPSGSPSVVPTTAPGQTGASPSGPAPASLAPGASSDPGATGPAASDPPSAEPPRTVGPSIPGGTDAPATPAEPVDSPAGPMPGLLAAAAFAGVLGALVALRWWRRYGAGRVS